jgi:Protein of unknown function (DUF3617)
MRPFTLAALSVLALALTSCGSKRSVDAKNESVWSVNRKIAASGMKPLPGRWESRLKIARLDMGKMPPEAAQMMQKSLGVERVFTSCLTPEQVNRPNAGFFQQNASSCKYDHFSMADGKIAGTMRCDNGRGPASMTMSGTYDESNYNISVSSQAQLGAGLPMNMTMAIAAHRTGACDGKEG